MDRLPPIIVSVDFPFFIRALAECLILLAEPHTGCLD